MTFFLFLVGAVLILSAIAGLLLLIVALLAQIVRDARLVHREREVAMLERTWNRS